VITEPAIREPSTHEGDPTVYLDVDGRHRPVRADYLAAFERLADDVRRRAGSRRDERVSRGVDSLPATSGQSSVRCLISRTRSSSTERLSTSCTRSLRCFSRTGPLGPGPRVPLPCWPVRGLRLAAS
jgi:hypothetical protein